MKYRFMVLLIVFITEFVYVLYKFVEEHGSYFYTLRYFIKYYFFDEKYLLSAIAVITLGVFALFEKEVRVNKFRIMISIGIILLEGTKVVHFFLAGV